MGRKLDDLRESEAWRKIANDPNLSITEKMGYAVALAAPLIIKDAVAMQLNMEDHQPGGLLHGEA